MKYLKRFITLSVIIMLAAGASACSKKLAPNANTSASPSATEAVSASPSAEPTEAAAGSAAVNASAAPATPVPPSSNKTVVKDDEAPEIYWPTSAGAAYHLKDCPELDGVETQKISWELVKMVGLRQCPVCNPPRYEGYVE